MMRQFLMVSLSSVFFVLVSNAETKTEAEQYIEQYASHSRMLANVTFTSSESSYVKSIPLDILRMNSKWKIDFDRKRYWREVPSYDVPYDYGGVCKVFEETSFLQGNHMTVTTYSRSNSDEVETEVSTSLKANGMWSRELRLLDLAFPLGYMQDGFNIVFMPDVCRAGETEVLATEPYIELRSKYRNYVITLTLDPQKNYSAKKIEIEEIEHQPASESYVSRGIYEVEKFIEVKGRWFPEKYNLQEFHTGGKLQNIKPSLQSPVMIYTGEIITNPDYTLPPAVSVSECILSDVDFPESMSDDEFKIKTPIPNGSVVRMRDAPQTLYLWRDGKCVPMLDQSLDKCLTCEIDEPRFLFLIIGGILILIMVGGQIWKYFNKRKNDRDEDKV
ncbi:MAG: hypothetical protein LBU65_07940 [Planctomycetaceae bacterium]|jgi:hypothetical protein|nr:hypothetical protein [Planctomycetaceae bacterium]